MEQEILDSVKNLTTVVSQLSSDFTGFKKETENNFAGIRTELGELRNGQNEVRSGIDELHKGHKEIRSDLSTLIEKVDRIDSNLDGLARTSYEILYKEVELLKEDVALLKAA